MRLLRYARNDNLTRYLLSIAYIFTLMLLPSTVHSRVEGAYNKKFKGYFPGNLITLVLNNGLPATGEEKIEPLLSVFRQHGVRMTHNKYLYHYFDSIALFRLFPAPDTTPCCSPCEIFPALCGDEKINETSSSNKECCSKNCCDNIVIDQHNQLPEEVASVFSKQPFDSFNGIMIIRIGGQLPWFLQPMYNFYDCSLSTNITVYDIKTREWIYTLQFCCCWFAQCNIHIDDFTYYATGDLKKKFSFYNIKVNH